MLGGLHHQMSEFEFLAHTAAFSRGREKDPVGAINADVFRGLRSTSRAFPSFEIISVSFRGEAEAQRGREPQNSISPAGSMVSGLAAPLRFAVPRNDRDV